jgi:hypothetical protein
MSTGGARTQANHNYSSGAAIQRHDSSFSHFNSYQKPASKQGRTVKKE